MASDQILHAFGGATRRAIVAQLGGGPASVRELARPLPVGLAAVVRHVQVLEANAKRAALPDAVAQRASFRVGDASSPSALGRFGSVFDSGFTHLLDAEASDVLARDLARTLVPSGRLYLHAFAVEFPVPNVPRAVTEGELRERFAESAGWRVLHVAPAEFANTVAAPTPAIVACIERT